MTDAITFAGAAHAGVVAALHRATMGATSAGAPWSEASVRKLLGQPGAFAQIAMADESSADGTPVGFALWVPVGDGLDLAAIGVDHAWRRRGIARRLMETAIAQARAAGVPALTLEVAEDNFSARALYGAVGFSELSRRPGYYRRAGGEGGGARDAHVLRLDLTVPVDLEKARYLAGET